MSANSKIEWTDHTFNPWIGCTKVSPACEHCYAEVSTPSRTLGVNWGSGQPRRMTSSANWKLPLRWNAGADKFFAEHGRRQRVFCASLADVFDNQVPNQWRQDLFDLIADTPHLDWLLLTKRIGNAKAMIAETLKACCFNERVLETVWIGATICNQEEADRDIPKLLSTPAAVRFLSMEPLLGPVDLKHGEWIPPIGGGPKADLLRPWEEPLPSLDWIIVGGESGPDARPMHPAWARSLRDQCATAGVPFLFKQWGEWCPAESVADDDERNLAERWIRQDGSEPAHGEYVDFFGGDEVLYRVGKKSAGRLLDGVQHDGYPETAA